MDVTFDKTQVVEYIERTLEDSGVLAAIGAAKALDWNPFNDDGDEYVGPWQEMRHNCDLILDVARAAILLAETIVIDGRSLTNPQKRDAVVQVLDDCIRLPWYAEPFDGIAIGLLVDSGVAAFNALGWVQEIPGEGQSDAKAVKVEARPLLLDQVQARVAVVARARRIKDSSRR